MTTRPILLSALAALALAGAGFAAAQAAKTDDVRAQIAKRLEIKVEDVRPSPIAGLYEVRSGAEVGYVSADGRFYVDGDVFDMTSKQNLTEDVRRKGRLALLSGIKDQDAIIFAPKGAAKHTVTVFTDVDCVHCRRMHSEIAELNRLGIRVRYLMFPRGGPGSDAWAKAESVWCSADRKDALTRAKKGEKVEAEALRNADRRAVRARPPARRQRHARHLHRYRRVPGRLCVGGVPCRLPGGTGGRDRGRDD